MDKEIKIKNENIMREVVRNLNKQGYKYKIFADMVGFTQPSFCNFMSGASIHRASLRILKNKIEKKFDMKIDFIEE